jgi:hypothetical protein
MRNRRIFIKEKTAYLALGAWDDIESWEVWKEGIEGIGVPHKNCSKQKKKK